MDGHDSVDILVLKLLGNKCSADTEIPTPPLVEDKGPLKNVYISRSGSTVVKALCCKPEGRGFKSR
jgi:hypothetical protein